MPNYVVVLPVTPLELGDGFTVADWPLHVTVVPKFVSTVDASKLVAVLRASVRGRAAINDRSARMQASVPTVTPW